MYIKKFRVKYLVIYDDATFENLCDIHLISCYLMGKILITNSAKFLKNSKIVEEKT